MKKTTSFFLALHFIFTSPFCFGKVLVAPTSVSEPEFTSALRAYGDVLSPMEDYLHRSPSMENMKGLAQSFAQAEKTFVEAVDLSASIPLYRKVLSMEMNDDWDETHRKFFLISYLRLLQINPPQESETEKIQWKGKALFYLENMEAPTDLIPPSIFRNLELEKNRFPLRPVQIPSEIKTHFQKVLVQGRVYSTKKPFVLRDTNTPLRWTFLSHFYQPVTLQIRIGELSKQQVALHPYVQGDCEKAQITENQTSTPTSLQIYHPLHCTLNPSSLAKKPFSKEIHLPVEKSTPQQSWIRNRKSWILIGVGVVATAVILSQTHKDKGGSSSSTETYGF